MTTMCTHKMYTWYFESTLVMSFLDIIMFTSIDWIKQSKPLQLEIIVKMLSKGLSDHFLLYYVQFPFFFHKNLLYFLGLVLDVKYIFKSNTNTEFFRDLHHKGSHQNFLFSSNEQH